MISLNQIQTRPKEQPHRFVPLPWQVLPWRDESPVVLLTGSGGGGKSRLCAEKVNGFATEFRESTCVIARKALASMRSSTILFYKRLVRSVPGVVYKASEHRFEYPNGSIVIFIGMNTDEDREKIRSIGLEGGVDFFWMEEGTEFWEEDFDEIGGRMRGRAAPWTQILISTNPGARTHWIYQRLMEQKEATVYYSRTDQNPVNPKSYKARLANMRGVLGLRMREGIWAVAEGAVYEDFRRETHIVRRFEIPPSWRRIRSIDFGYKNPFVCQWWAIDPDDRMYLYREIYESGQVITDLAKKILEYSGDEVFEATVTDHEAGTRAMLHHEGIDTTPAWKEVSPGIQAVRQRLAKDGIGKPSLFFFEDALMEMDPQLEEDKKPWSTTQEIEGYVLARVSQGRIFKEEPVKENDHGMDAMRYAVSYVDQIGEMNRLPKNAQSGQMISSYLPSVYDDLIPTARVY